jgi:hypothetical protein
VTIEKALQMVAPFEGLPYYDEAVTQIQLASISGKRELRSTAYRIRDAFVSYDYAVNYGKAEAA